ncbi:MAG: pyridoxal phosphate-dependent aminotransferase family protein [Kiritimatiellae bacterium]|nr:pyridoxal phosphate-dependent aminotransferase family protein [Kiritimatiellia bacterium]
MISSECLRSFSQIVAKAKEQGYYPYFHSLSASFGPEVEIDSKRVIMAGSNDYLGLSNDPRVIAAATDALHNYGTGPGGSRFLNGNSILHDQLEERLAALTGKRKAIVHTTGFMTNLGIIGSILEAKDVILCDHDNHASIISGCDASPARMIVYRHNDPSDVSKQLEIITASKPDARILIITDGVFSMSGNIAKLQDLVDIKEKYPQSMIYVDDAHGIGVIGKRGRGTADYFGVTKKINFIMGTFSKALASIGGFVASDDEDLMLHLKHYSRTLIFSAALPASSTAAVLAALDIIEKEPERIRRLHENATYMRENYRKIGIGIEKGTIPILPIPIGNDTTAYNFASELFRNGVFAMPAVHPAVPRGCAIIRSACMATHEKHHMDRIIETLDSLIKKYHIRKSDLSDNQQNTANDQCP